MKTVTEAPFFPFALIEAAPLMCFLLAVGLLKPTISAEWLAPYLTSSLIAGIYTAVFYYKNFQLNPIFLGIHLYLLSGLLGLILQQQWLNDLYGQLQAAGMLLWIFALSLTLALIKPYRFISAIVPTQNKEHYCYILAVFTLLAIAASLYFQGDKLLSEYLPFVLLFAAQRVLKHKL